MALVGLVRVRNDIADAARQHGLLNPLCGRVFEEPASRRSVIANRPELYDALTAMESGDELAVEQITSLGPDRVNAHIVLARLHDLGVPVRILTGYASGAPLHETVEYGRALDRSRRLVRRLSIQEGQREARTRGALIGRPSVVDDETRSQILELRLRGVSPSGQLPRPSAFPAGPSRTLLRISCSRVATSSPLTRH